MLMAFAARALPFSRDGCLDGQSCRQSPLELPDRRIDFGGDATIGGKQLVLVASGSDAVRVRPAGRRELTVKRRSWRRTRSWVRTYIRIAAGF